MTTWCNGAWSADDRLEIAAGDRALALGDGLFETMLWDGVRVVRLERHLERLRASARHLGLAVPDALAEVADVLPELAKKNGLFGVRGALKLILGAAALGRGLDRLDGSTRLWASAATVRDPGRPSVLATVRLRRNETSVSARHKTISYADQIEARRQARAAGADEAVQLNMVGALACAGAGNLVVIMDGRACTPLVEDGALAGTVRAELLRSGLLEERQLTFRDIANVEAAAVTNALIGVHPAASWDGRTLAHDHPKLCALHEALGE